MELIKPTRQLRSQDSLNRIVKAAETSLREDGVEGFSIARISEISGVSVGGIYKRVAGKTELLQALKDQAISRIEDAVRAALENRRFRDFSELMEAFIGALMRSFVADEVLHHQLYRSADANPAVGARGEQGRVALRTVFREAATPLLPGREDVADRAATVVYDLVIGAMIQRMRSAVAHDTLSWKQYGAEMIRVGVLYFDATTTGSADASR